MRQVVMRRKPEDIVTDLKSRGLYEVATQTALDHHVALLKLCDMFTKRADQVAGRHALWFKLHTAPGIDLDQSVIARLFGVDPTSVRYAVMKGFDKIVSDAAGESKSKGGAARLVRLLGTV